MNIGVATAIFKQLDNKSYSDAEKVEALDAVVNMETDNGITKADYKCALNWLWTHIEKESTVDAVEVVRCKDCKYYNPHHHYCEGIGNWFGIEGEWSDNGYCYKGERREDGK